MKSQRQKTEERGRVHVPEPYTEDYPARWNNMFGSLFDMIKAPQEKRIRLTENWYKIIRHWYPDLHHKVYSAPPVHFRVVSYKPKPEDPRQPLEPYLRFGMRMYQATQYSTVKDDEAQQRVLWTFSAFCRRKSRAAFILSNMEFQNYLNKPYDLPCSAEADFPKPKIVTNTAMTEEGSIDVLIIDKQHGVVVLEVKALGDLPGVRTLPRDKQIVELRTKLNKIVKQMTKELSVVERIVSDLNVNQVIKIKGGFVFPNIARDLMEEVLQGCTDKEICPTEFGTISFCAEEFPERYTSGESRMDDALFQRIDHVWTGLERVYGRSKPMEDEIYERLVARFCGPLTTVQIYTGKNFPRVRVEVMPRSDKASRNRYARPHVKTKVVPEEAVLLAGAARIVARKFSELVLMQDQIEVLQRNDDFVHLEGPPGTGKTLVLLLRILTWLDEGHMVWLVSLSPDSRSVTHVLMEQVKKMIDKLQSDQKAVELASRLRLFVVMRDESTLDEEYYRRLLVKFLGHAKSALTRPSVGHPNLPPVTAPHDRKACLVLDECGVSGTDLHAFFKQVAAQHSLSEFRNRDFHRGLSVWSASIERFARPCYVTEPGKTNNEDKFGTLWTLKVPVRCPPTIQRALTLVQPYLDQNNVCCFDSGVVSHPTGSAVQYPADGLPVYLIAHGNHDKWDKDIWYCSECGDDLGSYLQNTLHIGEKQCACGDKNIAFESGLKTLRCTDCGKLAKGSLPLPDRPLGFNDVMIVATRNASCSSLPISDFVRALTKRKMRVAFNAARDRVSPDDQILIVDVTSVHGLERAVIVVVPEINSLPPSSQDQQKTIEPEMQGLDRQTHEHADPRTFVRTKREHTDTGAGQDAMKEVSAHVIDPVFIKHDPNFQAALETGRDVSWTAAGDDLSRDCGAGDVEMAESDKQTSSSVSHDDETHQQHTEAGEDDVIMSEVARQRNDSRTYANCHSEEQIKAALHSLSPQSRRDVFYIGSRAVCQLILIHLAKDH